MKKRVALTVGFLTATFWVLIFLAWQTGDRAVAGGIAVGVFLLGAAPLWLTRNQPPSVDKQTAGSWYVSFCGLVFLGILNWRLDVWLVRWSPKTGQDGSLSPNPKHDPPNVQETTTAQS
jgi:hypothetical protein